MQRYKFVFAKDGTHPCSLSDDEAFMAPVDTGTWVEYSAAIDWAEAEFKRGLEMGRQDGQTKVDAFQAIIGPVYTQFDLERARRKGFEDAACNVADKRITDQRTSQLLNELYHDRARLEKVVENAVNLAQDAASTMAEILEETFPGNPSEPLSQNLADLIMDAARLKQFADAYGD